MVLNPAMTPFSIQPGEKIVWQAINANNQCLLLHVFILLLHTLSDFGSSQEVPLEISEKMIRRGC